ISVKKETDFTPNGKVSTYLHDLVNVGDTIEASAPAGTFTLDDDKRPVTLISGGVGITPMISMLETLASKQTDQHINFVHAARSESVHAFREPGTDRVAGLRNASYMYGYSDLKGGNHGDFKGYLTKEVLKQATKEISVYYVVGPIPFMKHV